MEFTVSVVVLVLLVIFFICKSKWDEKELLQTYQYKNDKEWGTIQEDRYTAERFAAIREYYLANKGEYDVDDITWNDVDMDTIFMMMNNTQSSMGEDYLYAMLRKLQVNEEELSKREKLISFFQKHPKERNRVQTEFRFMGKVKELSLYKYINLAGEIPKHNPVASIFMCSMLFISIVLLGLSVLEIVPVAYGIVIFACTLVNNIIHYFNRKAKIEKYYQVFMHIIRTLNSAKELAKLDIPELKIYFDEIDQITDTFKSFERGAFLVFFDSRRGQGSFWDVTLDYFRMMFHIDLIKFDSMVKTVQSNIKELNRLYEILGFLDSMIAVASFRTFLGEEGYCIPVLHQTEQATFYMEGGYHPILEEPVANSIEAKRPVLITGSNASGKSTFIKTVAINGILAQTVHTAVAKNYEASYFKIMSSMALRDDLQGHESYYIVEIKSLKRILEQVGGTVPTLCFVDEVLRGTNTLERIAASAQILRSFADSNTICFAATHDLELTHILEQYYDNYHFQEEVVGDQVVFDYTLREGRANSRNAIKLLGMMGYDQKIIEKAEALANTFMNQGVWENL